MPDKRLIVGFVKQNAVYNRILEEERCWRQHKIRKLVESKHRSRHKSGSHCKSSTHQRRYSVEREWCRLRKKMIEESSKITASAAAPTSALEFWRQVVRCNGDTEDRWGHDGFEELEKPGPPVPQSFERSVHLSARIPSRSPSPAKKSPLPSPDSSPLSEVRKSHRKRKGKGSRKRKVKKNKTNRDKKRKSKKSRSRSRSFSSSSTYGSEIEWIEK
ncbi:unnamed protein product [Hymenolepis diminuta]|uniref:Uncharacterized protein n=1 Tax=Hymenolepis diminuta TaxID=6216 RepID=A0A564Y8F5_HYMDI|nr:unnamed protein product [Hymenolepis diminuta]